MINIKALQPELGCSMTTMLKSNFIFIVSDLQNMVYDTISPTFINFRLNIISVLIRINLEILWINFIAAEIVQKLPASVTQNRKNIFLNTGKGKKSWEWRKMDSKIISIHSRIREKHNGNKPGNFWHKARNSCPYRRNDQFGAKKVGKASYETLPTSST